MGDDQALQEQIDLHHGRLVGVLRLRGCTPDQADDLAQEAMLRMVKRWEEAPPVENWWAWLVRVAVNLQVSQWRRLATVARRGHLVQAASEHRDSSMLDVLDLLNTLTKRQRTAIVLRFYADLSVRETAELMGASESAIKSLTAAGLAAAREEAGDREVVL